MRMSPRQYVTMTCTTMRGPRNGRMARARTWNGMLPTFATTKRATPNGGVRIPIMIHDHDHAAARPADAPLLPEFVRRSG
jgi:hypothetical protein